MIPEGTGHFKLVFSNLRKFYYSVKYTLKQNQDSFSIIYDSILPKNNPSSNNTSLLSYDMFNIEEMSSASLAIQLSQLSSANSPSSFDIPLLPVIPVLIDDSIISTSDYLIEDYPFIIRNGLSTTERFYILTTASYIDTLISVKENMDYKYIVGGKFFELEGNQDCKITFKLDKEAYLDRKKQNRVRFL